MQGCYRRCRLQPPHCVLYCEIFSSRTLSFALMYPCIICIAAADLEAAKLAGDMPLVDIPQALKRAASRDVALLTLQRHVVGIISTAGMGGLAEHTAAGFGGLPLEGMLKDVAEISLEKPASVPAILVLGVLGFCGHPATFKAVRLLHVIPEAVNGPLAVDRTHLAAGFTLC